MVLYIYTRLPSFEEMEFSEGSFYRKLVMFISEITHCRSLPAAALFLASHAMSSYSANRVYVFMFSVCSLSRELPVFLMRGLPLCGAAQDRESSVSRDGETSASYPGELVDNFNLLTPKKAKIQEKQTVPYKSTAEEVSFEWSHHRILLTDLKVGTTLHVSLIDFVCEKVKRDPHRLFACSRRLRAHFLFLLKFELH